MSEAKQTELATFGGGCFWCTEAVFDQLDGVLSVTSGYTGGKTENPSYRDICTGDTGHAEVIQIEYNPDKICFRKLLEVFFAMHDPTTLNRQGNDFGSQYRSAIFCHSDEQCKQAEACIKQLNESGAYQNPIVTEVTEIGTFYPAEEYHQDYYCNNPHQPYCNVVIPPKLVQLEQHFGDLLKQ